MNAALKIFLSMSLSGSMPCLPTRKITLPSPQAQQAVAVLHLAPGHLPAAAPLWAGDQPAGEALSGAGAGSHHFPAAAEHAPHIGRRLCPRRRSRAGQRTCGRSGGRPAARPPASGGYTAAGQPHLGTVAGICAGAAVPQNHHVSELHAVYQSRMDSGFRHRTAGSAVHCRGARRRSKTSRTVCPSADFLAAAGRFFSPLHCPAQCGASREGFSIYRPPRADPLPAGRPALQMAGAGHGLPPLVQPPRPSHGPGDHQGLRVLL